MAGVLLTHCNHLYFDRKQVRKMQPYPPLQTMLAAACLRRDGSPVAIFDSTFDASEERFRQARRQAAPLREVAMRRRAEGGQEPLRPRQSSLNFSI